MYYPLDEQSAPDYIRQSPVMTEVFGNARDLRAVDLAEGNINLIFRVYSEKDPIKRSVLIKQALPHSRRYPEFKIPLERSRIECDALQIEAKYCPGLVPKIYFYDPEMHLNVLEDLNRHLVMRYGLMVQKRYLHFAEHIGTFLARTLFYTSDFYLPSAEKKAQVARFINPVLCKVTEDLVFTQPYIEHPNNHWTRLLDPQVAQIHADNELRSEVLLLKWEFMANAQALIHGDLHTGSIMVNEEETKVIDPEFAYFGPMGFDIGAVLGNLALSYASQEHHAKDPQLRAQYREWLLDTIREVWTIFEREFHRLWETEANDGWLSASFRDKHLQRLLRDTAGFGACKMMRRIVGLAHVPDLDNIQADRARATAESLALNIARSWLMNRRDLGSVDDLIVIIRAAEPSIS
jgi:5-methylthioribose kinase